MATNLSTADKLLFKQFMRAKRRLDKRRAERDDNVEEQQQEQAIIDSAPNFQNNAPTQMDAEGEKEKSPASGTQLPAKSQEQAMAAAQVEEAMRNATPNKVKALESDVEGLKTAIAMVRSDHDELSSKLDTILLQLTALQDGRATEERDASLVALISQWASSLGGMFDDGAKSWCWRSCRSATSLRNQPFPTSRGCG